MTKCVSLWPVLYWFMWFRFWWPHFYLRTSVSVLPGACCATPHLKDIHPNDTSVDGFFHLHMRSKPVCYYFWVETEVEVQLRPYKFQGPKGQKHPKSTLKETHITSIYQILWSFMVSYIYILYGIYLEFDVHSHNELLINCKSCIKTTLKV